MTILEKMLKIAEEHGVEPTANVQKIANAKNMMFGEQEWERCPCDGQNPARFCISEQCIIDIKEKGRCHCNCYQPKQ